MMSSVMYSFRGISRPLFAIADASASLMKLAKIASGSLFAVNIALRTVMLSECSISTQLIFTLVCSSRSFSSWIFSASSSSSPRETRMSNSTVFSRGKVIPVSSTGAASGTASSCAGVDSLLSGASSATSLLPQATRLKTIRQARNNARKRFRFIFDFSFINFYLKLWYKL